MDELNSVPTTQVDPKALTFPDWLRLWWGLGWRGILIMAGSVLSAGALGFLTGAVIGLVLVMCGLSIAPFKLSMQIIGGCLGLAIGFVFFTVWFKWILRSRFGGLYLVLARSAEHITPPAASDGTAI